MGPASGVSWSEIPEPEWVWNLPGGRALDVDYQFKIRHRFKAKLPNFGLLYGLDGPAPPLTVWQRLLLGRHPG